MLAFCILLGILAVIVIGVEILTRATPLPLELTRKLTHILVGTTVALSVFFVGHGYLLILGLLFLLAISISRRAGIFRSIHDRKRGGIGEIWYPVGILLALALFDDPHIQAYAILVVAVCDGLAGLVGKTFGKRKIPFGGGKSYVGSLTFVVTAFFLSLSFMPLPIAPFAALGLGLIEFIGFKGLDNLLLPLVAGVVASLV